MKVNNKERKRVRQEKKELKKESKKLSQQENTELFVQQLKEFAHELIWGKPNHLVKEPYTQILARHRAFAGRGKNYIFYPNLENDPAEMLGSFYLTFRAL